MGRASSRDEATLGPWVYKYLRALHIQLSDARRAERISQRSEETQLRVGIHLWSKGIHSGRIGALRWTDTHVKEDPSALIFKDLQPNRTQNEGIQHCSCSDTRARLYLHCGELHHPFHSGKNSAWNHLFYIPNVFVRKIKVSLKYA